MEVKPYAKRPLAVGAFRFDAREALSRLAPGLAEIEVGPATLRREGDAWSVYNPGRAGDAEGPWQRVRDGDYVVIAPTGCRYPV